MDYTAEAVQEVHAAAFRLRPLEIVEQQAALRHFTARLRPSQHVTEAVLSAR
jgi:tryptophanase